MNTRYLKPLEADNASNLEDIYDITKCSLEVGTLSIKEVEALAEMCSELASRKKEEQESGEC